MVARFNRVRGFSIVELMTSLALITLVIGAVLTHVSLLQQRTRGEEVKVDIFQDAREFADQLMRDLHQAGYPSIRMFNTTAWTTALASPSYSDSRLATGIILISPSEIQFEGDVDGTGQVNIIDYKLVSSGNGCPCLQRSQGYKPSTGTLSDELQNVSNAGTTSDPIFVGYDNTGTTINTADLTTAAGRDSLASIKVIQWQIKIRAAILDPQTGQAPETTLHGDAFINNCSLAATGQANSC